MTPNMSRTPQSAELVRAPKSVQGPVQGTVIRELSAQVAAHIQSVSSKGRNCSTLIGYELELGLTAHG